MKIDFTQGKIYYRHQALPYSRELIAKAIGFKRGTSLTVFDTTAGLGRDAFLLAALGCQVILFERHPTVAMLLEEALLHAKTHPALLPTLSRMTLIKTCAIDYLQIGSIYPDVIYCDPMFPVRNKSAAVKKEMQFLHKVVGQDGDQDAATLVDTALHYAKKRVVVKRPRMGLPLKAAPHFSIEAKRFRFDIYIK
jgi:16S rRNA (guanine1516-N2)-methyltransferase